MNLKLLIYTHTWTPAIGGVETVTKALAEELARRHETRGGTQFSVQLVTLTPAGENHDDSLLPFEVVRRPSLANLIRLFRRADIVHLAGPALLPTALAWLFNKRSVLEHHNYQSVCPNGLLIFQPDHSICPGHFMARRYRRCIQCNSRALGRATSFRDLLLMFPRRFLAKRMTANVAPSIHMRDRAALPRTQVIYHGVAPFDAVPVPSASRANGPACFAFVGRLVKEKGVVTLFQAAHLLRQNGHQFQLTIVGDGPERLALEKLAAELGLADQTEFTGPVPAASIASALGEAAAIVMPSIWEDVAPLVALEQMMQGRLLIVSDIGGLGETVNGFGLKFPAGDAAALASCMEQVIECPNLAAEMGKKAHLHALKAYTLERMVDEHVCLYHELTRHPRN